MSDPDALLRMQILSDHLGQGRMCPESIARIAAITCDAEKAGGRLYRAVVVSAEEWERISRGDTLAWQERPVDCWSRSETSILHLLRTRVDQRITEGEPTAVGVILSREFAPEEVLIDVEEEARRLGMDAAGAGGYGWHAYAGKEMEVIVRNPPGPVMIRPEEVVSSWQGPDHQELFAPRVGETVFIEEDEVPIEEILGVDEDTGTMKVRAGGRTVGVIWDRTGFDLGASVHAFEAPSIS